MGRLICTLPFPLVRYKRFLHAVGLIMPFIILLSIGIILLMIQNRRNRSKHKKEIFSNELYLRKMIQTHKKGEMEIEPANVELFELLGEGRHTQIRLDLHRTERDLHNVLISLYCLNFDTLRSFWYCSKGCSKNK